MDLKTASPLRIVALIVSSAFSIGAFAQTIEFSFQAVVNRTILPVGETLVYPLESGTIVTGHVQLSELDSEIDKGMSAFSGNKKTTWYNAVKKLHFDDPIDSTFSGGNLYIENGIFQLSADPNYCRECSAEGRPFQLSRRIDSGNFAKKAYLPTRYMLAQSSQQISVTSSFNDAIGKMLGRLKTTYPKLILLYSENGSTSESFKIVLDMVLTETQ